jgi:hypothetical protein
MQLLELRSNELGVNTRGIYVVDDDEARVIAGPFDTDSLAAAWIDDWREFGSDLAEALGPSIQIR